MWSRWESLKKALHDLLPVQMGAGGRGWAGSGTEWRGPHKCGACGSLSGVQALRLLALVIAPVIPELPFKVQKGLILQVMK